MLIYSLDATYTNIKFYETVINIPLSNNAHELASAEKILCNFECSKNEFIIIFFVLFLLNIFVMLYLILKLNSLIYITQDRLLQKQFTKIVIINFDDITDVKLSFAYYAKVPYAINIYASNKIIMFIPLVS